MFEDIQISLVMGYFIACRCVCDTVCLEKNCLLTEKFGGL